MFAPDFIFNVNEKHIIIFRFDFTKSTEFETLNNLLIDECRSVVVRSAACTQFGRDFVYSIVLV